MHVRIRLSLLAMSVLAVSGAHAQDLTIDDFSTGPYHSPQYKTGIHASNQNGGMLGGNRSTNLYVCAAPCATGNPYNQAASYTFQPAANHYPSAFIYSAGFDLGPRVDMAYGFGAAMRADFSPYDRIRVNFLGLAENLNFNIQLFTGTAYAQGGCNILAYPGVFSVELPLSLFVKNTGFSQADINFIDLIFQSGSAVGAVDFAVVSVEASNKAKPSALSCHY